MTELNFVERIGLEVLRRRIDRAESHIHEWSDAELAEIQFESPAQWREPITGAGLYLTRRAGNGFQRLLRSASTRAWRLALTLD
jgi:hypothetical protein